MRLELTTDKHSPIMSQTRYPLRHISFTLNIFFMIYENITCKQCVTCVCSFGSKEGKQFKVMHIGKHKGKAVKLEALRQCQLQSHSCIPVV